MRLYNFFHAVTPLSDLLANTHAMKQSNQWKVNGHVRSTRIRQDSCNLVLLQTTATANAFFSRAEEISSDSVPFSPSLN